MPHRIWNWVIHGYPFFRPVIDMQIGFIISNFSCVFLSNDLTTPDGFENLRWHEDGLNATFAAHTLGVLILWIALGAWFCVTFESVCATVFCVFVCCCLAGFCSRCSTWLRFVCVLVADAIFLGLWVLLLTAVRFWIALDMWFVWGGVGGWWRWRHVFKKGIRFNRW